jgi:endonuclease YncB( thermonuclease family)
MKPILIYMVLGFSLLGADEPTPQPQIVIPVFVRECYDGDTATVEATIRMRVRLMDAWAPEVKGEQKRDGMKSKKRLEELCLGKKGLLTIPLYDDLGQSTTLSRVKGWLNVDGKDVSAQMVQEGFATKTKEH